MAVAALFVPPAEVEDRMVSVQSMVLLGIPVLVGSPAPSTLATYADRGCWTVLANDPAEVVNAAWERFGCAVLALGDAVTTSPYLVSSSLALMREDVRIATGLLLLK